MSDALLMQRMERGREGSRARPGEPGQAVDHGWFMDEGPTSHHFRVWPLIAAVLFPCMGVILVGFDSGATAWLVSVQVRGVLCHGLVLTPHLGRCCFQAIGIKLCSHEYSNWCLLLEDNVWLMATLESTSQMAAFVACLCIYLVSTAQCVLSQGQPP